MGGAEAATLLYIRFPLWQSERIQHGHLLGGTSAGCRKLCRLRKIDGLGRKCSGRPNLRHRCCCCCVAVVRSCCDQSTSPYDYLLLLRQSPLCYFTEVSQLPARRCGPLNKLCLDPGHPLRGSSLQSSNAGACRSQRIESTFLHQPLLIECAFCLFLPDTSVFSLLVYHTDRRPRTCAHNAAHSFANGPVRRSPLGASYTISRLSLGPSNLISVIISMVPVAVSLRLP